MLVKELHLLYASAERPALRNISKEIANDNDMVELVSHATVGEILHGRTISSIAKVECIARALIAMTPAKDRPDINLTIDRIRELWKKASGISTDSVTKEPKSSDLELRAEQLELMPKHKALEALDGFTPWQIAAQLTVMNPRSASMLLGQLNTGRQMVIAALGKDKTAELIEVMPNGWAFDTVQHLGARWLAELLTALTHQRATEIGAILLENDDNWVRMKSDVLPMLPPALSEAIQSRAILEKNYEW